MANQAAFTINGTPSEDPGTGDRQYTAIHDETLVCTLEVNPSAALSAVFEVFDPADLESPFASKDAPLLTWTESGLPAVTIGVVPFGINDDVNIDMPSAVAPPDPNIHSYVIRCTVATPGDGSPGSQSQVFEREVLIFGLLTTPSIRKTVPGETTQARARAWSDSLNDLIDAMENLSAAAGGTLQVAYNTGNTIDVTVGNGPLLFRSTVASTQSPLTVQMDAVNVLEVDLLGAVSIDPTSGQNFDLTTLGGGTVNVLSDGAIVIDAIASLLTLEGANVDLTADAGAVTITSTGDADVNAYSFPTVLVDLFSFPNVQGAAASVLTDVLGDGVLTFEPVPAATVTLQNAYDNGQTIDMLAATGNLVIDATDAVAFQLQKGAVDVIAMSVAGAVDINPTSGQDFNVTTLGVGEIVLSRGGINVFETSITDTRINAPTNVQLQVGGIAEVNLKTTVLELRVPMLQFDMAETNPSIIQETTGDATGQTFLFQAQNALTTGGAFDFRTGTGATAPGAMTWRVGTTIIQTLTGAGAVDIDPISGQDFTVTTAGGGDAVINAYTFPDVLVDLFSFPDTQGAAGSVLTDVLGDGVLSFAALPGDTTTLQDAYDNGNTVAATAARAIAFSNAVDLTDLLVLTRTFVGAGAALDVNMGPGNEAVTGDGINIASGTGATGRMLFINNLGSGAAAQIQDGGVDRLLISGAGDITLSGVAVAITAEAANDIDITALTTGQLNLTAVDGNASIVASGSGIVALQTATGNVVLNANAGGDVLIQEGGVTRIQVLAAGGLVFTPLAGQDALWTMSGAASAFEIDLVTTATFAIRDDGGATPVLAVDGAGALDINPTSGQDFTVTTAGGGDAVINAYSFPDLLVDTFSFPDAQGAAGSVLTDVAGDGVLTFAALPGGGGDLQDAYDVDPAILINSGQGPVAISNAADLTDLMTLIRTFVGAGDGLVVDMGPANEAVTGRGIEVTSGTGATGTMLFVDNLGAGRAINVQDAGNDIFYIDAAGDIFFEDGGFAWTGAGASNFVANAQSTGGIALNSLGSGNTTLFATGTGLVGIGTSGGNDIEVNAVGQISLTPVSGQDLLATVAGAGEILLTRGGASVFETSGTTTTVEGAANVFLDVAGGNIFRASGTFLEIFVPLMRFDAAVLSPDIIQENTGDATGQPLTFQSQNALTTGGAFDFRTGTGATAPGAMTHRVGATIIQTISGAGAVDFDPISGQDFTVTTSGGGDAVINAYSFPDVLVDLFSFPDTHGAAGSVLTDVAGDGVLSFAALPISYDTVQDEGSPLTQRTTINFVGAGVSAVDSGGVTTVTIAGGGSSSLQDSYAIGNTIAVTTANGSVALSNSADVTDVLAIDRTFVGGGNGLSITMGEPLDAAVTGIGLSIVSGIGATGDMLFVNNQGSGDAIDVQDGGVSVFQVTGAGAVNIDPTSGQDLTLTTLGVGDISLLSQGTGNIDLRVATGSQVFVRINSVVMMAIAAAQIEIVPPILQFDISTTAPSVVQQADPNDDVTAQSILFQAQSVSGGGTTITAGDTIIRGGNANAGTATNRLGGDGVLQGGTGTVPGDVILRTAAGANIVVVGSAGQVDIDPTSGQDFIVTTSGGGEAAINAYVFPDLNVDTFSFPDANGAAGSVLTDVAGDGVLTFAALPADTTTLQDAYDNGNTIAATAARTIAFSNAADLTDLLTLTRTFAGAGDALDITMAAATTGSAINIDYNSTAGAVAFNIDMDAAATGDAAHITHNGASGALLKLTNSVADMFDIDATGSIIIAGNSGQAVQITAEGVGTYDAGTLGSGDATFVAAGTGDAILAAAAGSVLIDAVTVGNVELRTQGVARLIVTQAGAVDVDPASGQNFDVTVLAAGLINLLALSAIDVRSTASNITISAAAGIIDLDAPQVDLAGYLQFVDITAPANPAAGQGRLYKKTGDDGIFWKPDAAGPEVDLTTGSASPLQDAYAAGNTIAVTTANGAVALSNSADVTDLLQLSRTFVGAGDGIDIDMGPGNEAVTGRGIDITSGTGATGTMLFVNQAGSGNIAQFQDGGTDRFLMSGAGAITLAASASGIALSAEAGGNIDIDVLTTGTFAVGGVNGTVSLATSGTGAVVLQTAGVADVVLNANAGGDVLIQEGGVTRIQVLAAGGLAFTPLAGQDELHTVDGAAGAFEINLVTTATFAIRDDGGATAVMAVDGAGQVLFNPTSGQDFDVVTLGIGDINLTSGDDIILTSTGDIGLNGILVSTAGAMDMNDGDITEAATITFGAAPGTDTSTSGVLNIDFAENQKREHVLDENVTSVTFTAPLGIGNFMIAIVQAAGVFSLPAAVSSWPAAAEFIDDVAPVAPAADGNVILLGVYYDGTTYRIQTSGTFNA